MSLSASEIGFVPQPFVRWFHPFELARAAVRTLLADTFGAYTDRRELQAALHPHESNPAYDYVTIEPDDPVSGARPSLWVDFVADIGDGFNATYAIASLLGKKRLALSNRDGTSVTTERGAVLIMGGDEVYPAASRSEYEQRTVGPYRAAFPYEPDEAAAPHVFAIPGNHDWYDGLSAFLTTRTSSGCTSIAIRSRRIRSACAAFRESGNQTRIRTSAPPSSYLGGMSRSLRS